MATMENQDPAVTALSDEERFSKRQIRNRLDLDGFNDEQSKIVIAAIRNPWASTGAIADHVDTEPHVVFNTIVRLLSDGYKVESYDESLDRGTPQFLDFTVKRRSMIDFLARHPNALDCGATLRQLVGMCYEETGVSSHQSLVSHVKRDNKDDVIDRRRWYRNNGQEDKITQIEVDRYDERTAGAFHIADKLARAGIDFPDTNLDGIETYEDLMSDRVADAVETRRQNREAAAESGDTEPADGPTGNNSLDSIAKALFGDDDTTETEVGKRSYKGPSDGVDTTSGREPSYIHTRKVQDDVDGDNGDDTDSVDDTSDDTVEVPASDLARLIESVDSLTGEVEQLKAKLSTVTVQFGDADE